MASVLVIDGDESLCAIIGDVAREFRWTIDTAATGGQGIERFMALRPDIVVLEAALADRSGLSVLEELAHKNPKTPVIVIAARGAGQMAIEALRLGACDFHFKPLSTAQLRDALRRALRIQSQLPVGLEVRETAELSGRGSDALLGRSIAMQDVYKAIGMVASHEIPVLISGGPGAGKQTVARAIHDFSRHAAEPLTVVRCASPCEGAKATPLPAANTGTLLLADVDRLSPDSQRNLLDRLSAMHDSVADPAVPSNAAPRVLASTTVDLAELAARGRFLPELFYELSCFSIRVPELRERIEDLPMLAEHFLRLWSRRLGKRVYQLSPPAREALQSHAWPGNLRELQSVVCQAVVRAKGSVLLPEHLPEQFNAVPVPSDKAPGINTQIDWRSFVGTYLTSSGESLYDEALTAMEVPLLKLVLHSTEGNQARAAKILGMTRGRLRQKLRERRIVIDRSVAVHRGESRNVTDEMRHPADVA